MKAALLREAARFQRRVSTTAQRTVERVYKPVLIGMAPTFLPSGYTPQVQAGLKVATRLRGSRLTVIVSAATAGTKGRDIKAREAGSLRHPVFARGRKDTWRWVHQRIKPGMGSVPLKAVRPLIVVELEAELRDIARDVERV